MSATPDARAAAGTDGRDLATADADVFYSVSAAADARSAAAFGVNRSITDVNGAICAADARAVVTGVGKDSAARDVDLVETAYVTTANTSSFAFALGSD